MSNCSQNPQNHGFEILTFDFYLEGKKTTANYCLYECKHITMKKWKNYCALLVNLFATLRQSHSLVEVKMVNYWAEISKLLPRDKIKFCTVHSNYLGCNQITKFTSNFWN